MDVTVVPPATIIIIPIVTFIMATTTSIIITPSILVVAASDDEHVHDDGYEVVNDGDLLSIHHLLFLDCHLIPFRCSHEVLSHLTQV